MSAPEKIVDLILVELVKAKGLLRRHLARRGASVPLCGGFPHEKYRRCAYRLGGLMPPLCNACVCLAPRAEFVISPPPKKRSKSRVGR